MSPENRTQSPSNYLKELRFMAKQHGPEIATICEEVFGLPEFDIWSACQHPLGHHYGHNGLAKHTYEVAKLVRENGFIIGGFGHPVDWNVLFLASVFHDIGKIYDYNFCVTPEKVEWVGTPHKRLIHHISRSGIIWSKAVDKTSLCKDLHDDVLHCILSHHGKREFGSPVAPFSREAWILHLCDSLSARSDDCSRLDMVVVGAKQ